MGTVEDRKYHVLSDDEITRIVSTYQSWCGNNGVKYADFPGFCASSTTTQIAERGYKLTPGPFVGSAEIETDDTPFEEKMEALCKDLKRQLKTSEKLDSAVRGSLKSLGYEV